MRTVNVENGDNKDRPEKQLSFVSSPPPKYPP